MDKDNFILYKKQKILSQLLQKMLKRDLIFQIMNQSDLLDVPEGKIKTFSAFRPETQHLTDDNDKNKKVKKHKKCVRKRKLKLKIKKNCLDANQFEKERNYLEKNKVPVDILRQNHEEFIRNNRLTLKSQQRFGSKKHIVFSEEVNKIALSAYLIITEYNKQI